MVAAVIAESRYDPRADEVEALDAQLTELVRSGAVAPGTALEAMFDHCIATWRARPGRLPPEHRVFERDGWRCTVPGCSSYRNLHDHHIRFRSAGGSDDEANRTTLCAWHHLRGVHAGRVRLTGRAPEGLRFELGVRRDPRPLLTYEGFERLTSPA